MTETQKPTRISAKDLGALALPDACPRCFWIKQKCKPLPFQLFPGIFSTLDAYQKKIVQATFDKTGGPPPWLPSLKDAFRYWRVPHWSKFIRTDPNTGIVLSGVADGIFENVDGSLTIPDYKTAKFTKTQDALFPMYEVQLNGYGWIQEALTSAPVKHLVLIYFEPVTDSPSGPDDQLDWLLNKHHSSGFGMMLQAYELQIAVNFDMVTNLLVEAKNILDQVEPPQGRHDCKDCANLGKMHEMLGMF